MHFSKSHIIYIGIYGYLKILRLSCDTFNSYTLFYVRVPAYMWAFLGSSGMIKQAIQMGT